MKNRRLIRGVLLSIMTQRRGCKHCATNDYGTLFLWLLRCVLLQSDRKGTLVPEAASEMKEDKRYGTHEYCKHAKQC